MRSRFSPRTRFVHLAHVSESTEAFENTRPPHDTPFPPFYHLAARVGARLERASVFGPGDSKLQTLELHPKVTFFVGENGSGKSTLLEAIAEKLGFNIDGGTKNTNMAIGEYISPLTSCLRVSRTINRPMDGFFLRAESFYNFATLLDVEKYGTWSYGGKSLHEQSHGESFLATMTHRMGGHGVYLFDEPEAALSPQRQLSMLVRLHDLVDDFSQFIIATHSPLLLAYPDAWIYQFSPDGIERIAYEDTEHFQITRTFMHDHKRMLKRLLRKEDELDLGE